MSKTIRRNAEPKTPKAEPPLSAFDAMIQGAAARNPRLKARAEQAAKRQALRGEQTR